jgi:hypothetical protein
MPQYKLKPGFKHYDYRDVKDEETGEVLKGADNKPVRERYQLKAGDIISMSQERFIDANLKDRFSPVGGSGSSSPSQSSASSASESDEESEESTESTDWSFIKTSKQTEVLSIIAGVEDKETAAKIYEAEESGKNRDKVLEAARQKYMELGGEVE